MHLRVLPGAARAFVTMPVVIHTRGVATAANQPAVWTPPKPPVSTLVDIPAFRLWLGLQGSSSQATGVQKLEDQVRVTTLSPLARVCRVNRESYQRVLGALRDAHLMLQIRNTVALSIVHERLADDPALERQANEVTKILDAEYGRIGVTSEHQYPHPRMLMDTYSSLNGGRHIPIGWGPINEFFERTALPDGEVMGYLGIFGNIEENANALLHSQYEFVNGIKYGRSPWLNSAVQDAAGIVPGRGIVFTFDHAHKPFEGDHQSGFLHPFQKDLAARDLGVVLMHMREHAHGMQAEHLDRLQSNIVEPDARDEGRQALSNDPSAADADHVELVLSLIEHFSAVDPTLHANMETTWHNTVVAYHQVVTPVLMEGLMELRKAEEAEGLHKAYGKVVPDAAEYLKEEAERIDNALADAAEAGALRFHLAARI